MPTYSGSCHCGSIAFEVDGEIGKVIECNCTHCQRKGLLLWFVSRDQFRLKTPRDRAAMSTYQFNRHIIEHHFCPTCGVQPFADGKDPAGNEVASINVRCLEDIDLTTLTRVPYDGRHQN
ncbi:GFA family protein [Uliginosibacterium sp. sgz301328]|uniref:GFA family protein n=1 Tax=Uliginosibacterium sp. sgz301328 TaxID=3243764 RepID=UPI00359DF030